MRRSLPLALLRGVALLLLLHPAASPGQAECFTFEKGEQVWAALEVPDEGRFDELRGPWRRKVRVTADDACRLYGDEGNRADYEFAELEDYLTGKRSRVVHVEKQRTRVVASLRDVPVEFTPDGILFEPPPHPRLAFMSSVLCRFLAHRSDRLLCRADEYWLVGGAGTFAEPLFMVLEKRPDVTR